MRLNRTYALSCLVIPILAFSLASCGSATFKTGKQKGASAYGGQYAALADCTAAELQAYDLYGGQYEMGSKKGDVVVVPQEQPIVVDGGEVVMPAQAPIQTKQCTVPGNKEVIIVPRQVPGQYPGDAYNPIDVEPMPFPGQTPGQMDNCGKGGVYCDQGGPGQWPGQTINGQSYDQGLASKCMANFHAMGVPTQGAWPVQMRKIQNVNVFSNGVTEDYGRGPAFVIIKDVNVLGTMRYRLMNPDALYCFDSVSVLQDNRVTSCFSNNVVTGSDVNVFVRTDTQVVQCR